MEKRYALFLEVLKCFQSEGLLKEMILIGSWCQYFYKSYFTELEYTTTIRTRDMDFLVPLPLRLKNKVDVEGLLRDKGFILTFSGGPGYMKLMHPELIVEFLVAEKGRGSDKPQLLPQLGINAQPLRFLDYFLQNTISIEADKLKINVPHPAAFGLHKLIVSSRRKNKAKTLKDRREAISVLKALIKRGESNKIKIMFDKMPTGWKKQLLVILNSIGETAIVSVLK